MHHRATGRLSGSGTWKSAVDADTVDSILLCVDVGGSFAAESEIQQLAGAEGGENPVLYFSTDKWYGYEIRRQTHRSTGVAM
jgi:hypothetical protein